MPISGLDRMPGSGLARGTLFDKELNVTTIDVPTITVRTSIDLEKSGERKYSVTWTQPTGADRILSIPALGAADTFIFAAATQTLTNKALTDVTDFDMTVGNKTILDTIGSNSLTIGAGGTTVIIPGNLTVSGTQTLVNTTTLQIADSLYALNTDESGTPSQDAGFVVERGTSANVGFFWDESADEFVVVNTSETGSTAGNVTISSYADLQTATLTAANISAFTLNGKLTAGSTEIEGSAFDINGGTVDAITSLTVANDIDVGSHSIRAYNFLADAHATLRAIIYAGTNGTLTSEAAFTYNDTSNTLTIDNITSTGTSTLATVDIGAGAIDGVTLGTNSAITNAVIDDVAINGKVITMTGSASDTAVFTAGTNGTLSIVTTDAAAAAANIQITADGTIDIDSAGLLTLDSGAAINIEPASGSAILLDGTISVDAGVVTGATSITSTAFVGALTGNATTATAATTITLVATNSTDATHYPVFVSTATGDRNPRTDTDFTYNSSTNTLTATNVAGTLTTAAQGNITSVGTLTDLTVSGTSTTIGTVTSGIWNAGAVTSSGAVTANGVTVAKASAHAVIQATQSTSGDYLAALEVVESGGSNFAMRAFSAGYSGTGYDGLTLANLKLLYSSSNTGLAIHQVQANPIWLQTNALTRMTITGAGNVGIGGSGNAVDTILHIEAADPILKLQDSSSDGDGTIAYVGFYSANGTEMGWVGDGSAGNDDIYLQASTGDLKFLANGTVSLENNTLSNVGGSGNNWTATVFTHDGGAIFNDSGGDYDFRVESNDNANMLVIDGALNNMAIGSAVDADVALMVNLPTFVPTAGQNGTWAYFDPALTEAGSGTHANMTGVHIAPLVNTNAGGATTNAATFRIGGAPTGATPTGGNYALWVDAGTSRFDGDVDLNSSGTLLNVGGSGNDWTATAFTHDGAATFNDSGGNYDFRIEGDTNANMIMVDASTNTLGFFIGASAVFGAWFSQGTITNIADQNYSRIYVSAQGAVTIPSGTAAYVDTLGLEEPVITATGTVTTASTLRIVNAPTEGTNNYALYVQSGVSRFGGAIIGNSTIDATTDFTVGGTVITDGVITDDLLQISLTDSANKWLKIYKSASGVTPNSNSTLVLERDGNNYIQFLGPVDAYHSIWFGIPSNATRGGFEYNHGSGSDVLKIFVGGGNQMEITASDVNLQSNSLSNIGAAGTDWDSTSLRNAADYFGANGKGMVIGHTAKIADMGGSGQTSELQVLGTGQSDASITIGSWGDGSVRPRLIFFKTEQGTIGGAKSIVGDDDSLGMIMFAGDDGGDYQTSAVRLEAFVDGTPGANDLPGRFTISTTANDSNSVTEHLSVNAAGTTALTNTAANVPITLELKNLTTKANGVGPGIYHTGWSGSAEQSMGYIFTKWAQESSAADTTTMEFCTRNTASQIDPRMTIHGNGDTDLLNNDLKNVGYAGSDWTSSTLTKYGTGDQNITIESTNQESRFYMKVTDAGSGYIRMRFQEGSGNGTNNNMKYEWIYTNNKLVLTSADTDGSGTSADIWRIDDGQMSIDANTTWVDNQFNDYVCEICGKHNIRRFQCCGNVVWQDDVKVISPYKDGVVNLKKWKEDLIHIGVFRLHDDGFVGYNDQRMAALLAGGIYQNRDRMDAQYETMEKRLKELEAKLEAKLELLTKGV